MIHTKKKPWFTILPTGPNFNYAAACQTHLLYMGNHIYGLLLPKPLPLPQQPLPPSAAVSITTLATLAPLQQQVSIRDAALPTGTTTEAESTTSGNMSEDTTNRDLSITGNNIIVITPQNMENTTPNMSVVSNTADTAATSSHGEVGGTDAAVPVTNSDKEPPPSPNIELITSLAVGSVNEPASQPPDDTSNDSSVVNLDKTTANVITKFSGILTKECRVVLKTLDLSTIGKITPGTLQTQTEKEDTCTTDSGKDTLSDPSSTDSDETPLSQLFNQDRGRP